MLVETYFGRHRSLPTQALHSPFQNGSSGCMRLPEGQGRPGSEKSEMEPGSLPVSSPRHDEGVVENNNPANTRYSTPVKPLCSTKTTTTLTSRRSKSPSYTEH